MRPPCPASQFRPIAQLIRYRIQDPDRLPGRPLLRGKQALFFESGHKIRESLYIRSLMRKYPGSNVLRISIRHDKLSLHAAVTEEIDLSQSLFALLVRTFDEVISCLHRL